MPAPSALSAALLLLLPAGAGAARLSNLEGLEAGPGAYFVKNDDIQNVLPLPPQDYPEVLRGMMWMDQDGSYAETELPATAPDLAFSFGDVEYSRYDSATRSISVDIMGPAWQWQNNHFGLTFQAIRHTFSHYEFVWSEDFEFCQIYPHIKGPTGPARVPAAVANFTMTRQHPPEGACPPAPDATKEEVSKCAFFRRETVMVEHAGPLGWLLNQMGLQTSSYYMFRIVDAEGQPIQPYYDAYLRWANEKAAPDAAAAEGQGYDLTQGFHGADGSQPGTSFVHVRS